MSRKLKTRRSVERWIVRRGLAAGLFLTRLFSLESVAWVSRMLADVGYYALGRNRRLAIQNLSLVYRKVKPPSEIRKMVREVFREGSRAAFEVMLYYGRGRVRDACQLVKETQGLEHLDRALQKGKGVVGLCAHLGNFVILGMTLDLFGYKFASIMRQMRDEQLEEMFTTIRNEMRQVTIPKFPLSRSIRDSLGWLDGGNILAMYIDQRSKGGAIVDFMGLPTSSAPGAAYFALRSGAPVLPMFVLRREDGFYKLLVGPEVPVVDTGNLKEDMHTNTGRFAKVAESYIRQYPTQWFWFDRRWKQFHKVRD